jgi:hypothetical protein
VGNTPPKPDARWDQLLDAGHVSFTEVHRAHYLCRSPDRTEREQAEWYYQPLYEAFANRSGGIEDVYFAETIEYGLVLTGDDNFEQVASVVALFADDLLAEVHLFECQNLNIRAVALLPATPRKLALRRLYDLATFFVGSLEREEMRLRDRVAEDSNYVVAPSDEYRRELATYAQELPKIADEIEGAAQRHAQYQYLQGVGIGIGLLGIVIAIVALAFMWVPTNWEIPAVVLAGGVGAVISVLTRVTFQTLTVDAEAGAWHLRVTGTTRPFIGAIFGMFLYLVLKGGLLSAIREPTTAQSIYFYSGLAFVMGFSERLAQDVLAGVGSSLTATRTRSLPAEGAAERMDQSH